MPQSMTSREHRTDLLLKLHAVVTAVIEAVRAPERALARRAYARALGELAWLRETVEARVAELGRPQRPSTPARNGSDDGRHSITIH